MKKILMLTFLVLFLVTGSVWANNVRPYDPGTLGSLQTELDSITVSGPGIDVVNDQISDSLFTNQSSGGAVATFAIEIAALESTNVVGIYDSDDPNNLAPIFIGSDGPGSQTLISFLSNGDIKVGGNTVASGFDANFGFYLGVYDSDGQTYGPGDGDVNTLDYVVYSEDSLNTLDDAVHALIYRGDDQTYLQMPTYDPGMFSNHEYIVAFEDWLYNYGSDKDFTDAVIMVESIQPVPEPATMLLLGSGLIGLAGFGRKKFSKKA